MILSTLTKDKRRTESFNRAWLHDECWKTSLKYSSQLNKNINNKDLTNLCHSIYGQYMSELKGRDLSMKNNNYIQIWTTMLNTVKQRGKTSMAIKLLYQTSIQHSS